MKKLTLILLVLLLLVSCTTKGESTGEQAKEESVTVIKDVRGREVKLTTPIKTAYYPYYYENLLAIAGEDVFEKIVATSVHDTKFYSKTFWEIMEKNTKGFKDMQDIGSTFQDNFDVEKLISIKPDVAILANYQHDSIGEDNLKNIEAAGIPVVFIDFTDLSPEAHYTSCTILGQVFSKEERAKELNEQYKKKIERIKEIVANIPEKERKTAYFEVRSNNPTFKEYGQVYGNFMIGQMATMAGIDNINKDVYDTYGDADPEHLFQNDPDALFIDGGNFDAPGMVSVKAGYTIDEATTQKTLTELVTTRVGWENLKAVKNKQVYSIDNDIMRTMRDYVIIEYLGKALHPEYFKEFDPIKENKEFIEKYTPSLPSDSCFFAHWEGKQ